MTTGGTQPGRERHATLRRARDRARAETFAGRVAEQALWRQWLEEEDAPFAVLWLFGPGGIGKTALLQRFAAIAESAGKAAHMVDVRELRPGEPLASLFDASCSRPGAAPGQLELEHLQGGVLLIDTEEKRVRMLRVEHGGLFGIGATPLFIPVEAIERITDDEVGIEQPRTQVADAPQYDPDLIDRGRYFTDLYGHYGYPPYWSAGYVPPARRFFR